MGIYMYSRLRLVCVFIGKFANMAKLLSVIDATNASIGYSRPVREGEQMLNAGFVISVGVKKKENSILHIQALVLRTSGVTTQHPYLVEIWIDLEKDYGSRVFQDKSIECECKAGESEKCKHVIAVMLYLARVEESDLEDLTCTDIEQQWGQLKASTLAEYQAKPLADLCHVQTQKNIYVASIPQVSKEMGKKWQDRLMRSNPSGEFPIFVSTMRRGQGLKEDDDVSARADKNYNAAVMSQVLTGNSWTEFSRLHDLTSTKLELLSPDVRQFYDSHVKVSIEQSVAIATVNQGTNPWLHERNKRLTASTAYSQYTYFVNPKANWEKRYDSLYHSSFSGNEDTIRGLRCEGVARDSYENSTGTKVYECGLRIRPELPWLGASLDGIVLDDQGEIIRSIEIKTLKEGTRLTAAELLEMKAVKTIDNNGKLKKTNDHYGQVQIGMLLSGISNCQYLVYSEKGNDFLTIDVPFDPAYVLDLVLRLASVYFDIFLPKIVLDFST